VFAGGAALQFQERHFFYLEFVPWWAFATLCRLFWLRPFTRDAVVRAGVFAAVCVTAAALIVGATRVYQDRKLRAMLDDYLAAPRRPFDGHPSHGPRLVTTFAVADIGGSRCPVDSVMVTIDGYWHRTIQAPVDRESSEPTHVVFTEYTWSGDETPVTVTVPPAQQPCLSQVANIDTSTFPVLLNATLAPGWRESRLHQRLTSLWK